MEKEPIKLEEHASSDNTDTNLSKKQLKKREKLKRWMATKRVRRTEGKRKRKQRLAERKEKGEDLGPSRKYLKLNTMENSACKIRVALDLSLDEYMSEKDIVSLTSQIQFSYSANRRAANPMQFYACGLGGRTQERLDSIGDYKGWDINFKNESYFDVFPKESIVYLSSESSNVLTSLSDDKVYIIGGLVDHNSHKGLCHRLAEEKGVAHAQLPISDYFHLKGRKVLAVNHVFSILLRFTETGDWKKAFIDELPTRKGFAPVFDQEELIKPDEDSKVGKEVETCDPDNNAPSQEPPCDATTTETTTATAITATTTTTTAATTSVISESNTGCQENNTTSSTDNVNPLHKDGSPEDGEEEGVKGNVQTSTVTEKS